jgi:hypothetical protein
MIGSPHELADSQKVNLSEQDSPLERAYRELEELRGRVREAERVAARSSSGLPPARRGERGLRLRRGASVDASR